MSTTTADADLSAGFLRRNRVALLVAVAALAVLVLISWLGRDQAGVGGDLDPQNPKPGGARAVAQVLEDHGVPVDVVRGRAALGDARIDARTTVVVSNPVELGASTWDELDERVAGVDAILVVGGLSLPVADGLGLTEADLEASPLRRTVPAQCDLALMEGLSLTSDQWEYGAAKGDGCFGDEGGRALLVDRDEHRWLLVNPAPMSNEESDLGENAAVVLRLLGQRDRVVWYVADAADTVPSDAVGVSRLLPRWLMPSLWLVGIAALALLLYRGRRLGPLVTEPLPVTVKALESTTTLGRLYERAHDRPHAARLLVEATASRLAARFGLSPDVSRAELVQAVAARTGRPSDQVAALLLEPGLVSLHVHGDADLVALAQNLHQLEEEVRSR